MGEDLRDQVVLGFLRGAELRGGEVEILEEVAEVVRAVGAESALFDVLQDLGEVAEDEVEALAVSAGLEPVGSALGQFERDLISERTKAGLAAAAARGRKGGRKRVVTNDRLQRARELIARADRQRVECPRGCRTDQG